MNTRKLSLILSAVMLGIYGLLMVFGMVMGICDLSHLSYITAFLVALVLCVLFVRFGNRIPVCENVLILTVLCFLVNGIWLFLYIPVQSGDYAIYLQYASLLAFGGGPARLGYVALFPHIFGYSYFLSFFLKLFGGYGVVAAGVNLFLTVGSGLIIWTLVKNHYGSRPAALAYLLWIICPSKLLYNVFCLSEPYYTNLLLLFLLLADRFFRSPGKWVFLLGIPAGLLLRLMNSARPIALIPIIALGIYIIFLGGYKKGSLLFFALLLAVYIPTGTLWDNYMESRLMEEPATGVPGYNVYVGFDSDHGGTHNSEDMDRLLSYYATNGQNAPEAQQQMLDDTIDRISSGNVDYRSLIPSKFRSLLGNDEGGAYYSREDFSSLWFKVASFLSNIWYYFVLLLSLLGAASAVSRKELCVLQLAPLYVIGLILAQMLVEVSGRYHYSILPMMILTASMYLGFGKPEEGL